MENSKIERTHHTKPDKPLGQRAYGSIPHLPGSRRGPADKGMSAQQARILTEKARDKHDIITVQEKLDGSNVAVANINGELVALIRAGYRADGSNYEMHHHFARWVESEKDRFVKLLQPGERVSGEWLMEAHGTIYDLPHAPFVAFDILTGNARALAADVASRCEAVGITFDPILIEIASELLPNRSKHAEEGVLRAVLNKIETLSNSEQKRHKSRLGHMIDTLN
jgi:hypothetical protein